MKISDLIDKLARLKETEGDLEVKHSTEGGSEESVYFVDVEKAYDVDGMMHKYILLS